MELIKRKINLGELRSKQSPLIYDLLTKDIKVKCCNGINNKLVVLQNAEYFDGNWGGLDFEYIHLNIFITQNIDDMGLFTDVEYVDEPVDYQLLFDTYSAFTAPLPSYLIFSASTKDPYIKYFARLSGQTESNFYASGGTITGITDDKLYSVTTYFSGNPFVVGLNLNDDPNYFTGVDGLYSNYTAYTIDASITNIGGTGIHYYTYDFDILIFNSTINAYITIPYTTFSFQSQGWNSSNTSLSAITKEEIYFGIVFPPKVENNVFIDRGSVSVHEKHSRLSSILSMQKLEEYGNGYYNLVG